MKMDVFDTGYASDMDTAFATTMIYIQTIKVLSLKSLTRTVRDFL
jgi:hypothetical protein